MYYITEAECGTHNPQLCQHYQRFDIHVFLFYFCHLMIRHVVLQLTNVLCATFLSINIFLILLYNLAWNRDKQTSSFWTESIIIIIIIIFVIIMIIIIINYYYYHYHYHYYYHYCCCYYCCCCYRQSYYYCRLLPPLVWLKTWHVV